MRILSLFLGYIFITNFAIAENKQQKIGIVEIQAILEQSSAVQSIKATMAKVNDDLKKQLTIKENELKNEEENLLKQKPSMKQDKFNTEVDKFNKKVAELQKFVQDKKTSIEKSHAEAIDKVNEVVIKVISDISFEQGFDMILSNSQLLYTNNHNNITNDVLSRLNAKLPSVTIQF